MGESRLRRGPLGGTGGEEGGPLPQFRSDLAEEHPGTAGPPPPALGTGARGQHGGGRTQRGQVGRRIPLPVIGMTGGLGEATVRLVEQLGGGDGQRRGQGQLTHGGHGSDGAHQSCTRTSHQRLPAASQDRSNTPAKLIRDRPARTASTRQTSRGATSAPEAPAATVESCSHQGAVSLQESSSSPTTYRDCPRQNCTGP